MEDLRLKPDFQKIYLYATLSFIDPFHIKKETTTDKIHGMLQVTQKIFFFVPFKKIALRENPKSLNPTNEAFIQVMIKKLLTILLVLLTSVSLFAQVQNGKIRGEVRVALKKQGLEGAEITLLRDGLTIGTTKTNSTGNYEFSGVEPGTYMVRMVYAGYESMEIEEIQVAAEQYTTVNIDTREVNELKAVKKVKYKVPLVNPDGVNGSTFTSKNIEKMATRNVNQIAGLTAKVNSFGGGTPSFAGSRTNATAYYVDGVRVIGSAGVPRGSIDQVQVIVGGVPAQYGDYTGGAISITTKGPSRYMQGGLEVISSSAFDPYHYNLFEGFLTGPLIIANKKNPKKARTVLGYSISGNFNYYKDPSPTVNGNWYVNDETLEELQNNPLRPNPAGNGFVNAAEFIDSSDFVWEKARRNSPAKLFAFTGNLSWQPTKDINVVAGGTINYADQTSYSLGGSLLNFQNNPRNISSTYRGFIRMTHYLKRETNKEGADKSAIASAFYTIRFDYTQNNGLSMDNLHGDRIFDYGYIGKFTTYRAPVYSFYGGGVNSPQRNFRVVNPYNNQDTLTYNVNAFFELAGYRDTLFAFDRAEVNPVRANYTSYVYNYFKQNYQGASIRNADFLRFYSGLLNGDNPNSVYSMWSNVGAAGSGYSKSQAEQYTVFAIGEVSIRSKNDPNKKHDLQFGLQFEQRFQRGYSVATTGLWSLMRQLTQKAAPKLDRNNPTLALDANLGFQDTVWYPQLVDKATEGDFVKNLRKHLMETGAVDAYGKKIDENSYLDVDMYTPENYNLNYFGADELLNLGNSYVNYYGYDYLGNKVKGKPALNSFLTDNKRIIGAFQPIYTAAFIQDKFAFKDLIFRVGLRVDRYDANQFVLKDPFSLYPVKTVGQLRADANNPLAQQVNSSMKDDYVVYVNDIQRPTSIVGYRETNTNNNITRWYNNQGAAINDPAILANQTTDGRIAPYLNNPDPKQSLTDQSFTDYKPRLYFMPRIWFKFPISSTAQFFANYDVLTQRPPEGVIATIDDYYFIQNRVGQVLNNPNLRPTRKTDYEIGFKQQIGDNSALSLIASYSEWRDMVQVTRFNQAYPITYDTYGNLDFGTVKGFRVEYELRSDDKNNKNINLFANYMLQFADGTGASAGSSASLIAAGQPNLRTLFPLDVDVRHTIKGNFDFHFNAKEGPIYNKKYPLANAGFNVIFTAFSGLPYTQLSQPVNTVQSGIVQRSQIKGTPFGARRPWQYFTDVTFDKTFPINQNKKSLKEGKKPMNLNVYLWISNIFNVRNVTGVYQYSGSPEDDGFLSSPLGQQTIQRAIDAQSFVDLYNTRLRAGAGFSLPRQIRLGARFNF